MTIFDIYRVIFKMWRRKRFGRFLEILSPTLEDRLLDVGGYPAFWLEHPKIVGGIDSLNVHPVDCLGPKAQEYGMRTMVGDGCALTFPDKSYDIVFSNSVIEHVGDWSRQEAFAREVRRVGKKLWLQTPARECPIEPHYLAPFVHWLSPSVQRWVIPRLTVRGWMTRPTTEQVDEMVETTRLITGAEMKTLFPDCEIHTEYLLPGIPKSYIAVRR